MAFLHLEFLHGAQSRIDGRDLPVRITSASFSLATWAIGLNVQAQEEKRSRRGLTPIREYAILKIRHLTASCG